MMTKVYGATERNDRLEQIGAKKWELIWGYGEEDSDRGYHYRHRWTDGKPTAAAVFAVLTDHINEQCDAAIASGFAWDGATVWLTLENQFNYKAAYDLAVQTGGASLPETLKFGDDDDPQYVVFETLDDFQTFYVAAMAYVKEQLSVCWTEKEAARAFVNGLEL